MDNILPDTYPSVIITAAEKPKLINLVMSTQ